MPELPEVETIRRDLVELLVGRTIVGCRIEGARTVRRQAPELVRTGVIGRTVIDVERLGKYLCVDLDDGCSIGVHLRMSGQLRWCAAIEPGIDHTHAWFDVGDGDQLRFVDPRTFGEIFLGPRGDLARIAPSLGSLGLDPFTDPPSAEALAVLLAGRRTSLKAFLLRQDVLCGLGNIYSDEILHRSRLRFDRRCNSLSPAETAALARGLRAVLIEAVEARGSSLSDAQYVDVLGRAGRFQAAHRVYAREGQPCLSCRGQRIVRHRFQQRSTFACPGCQS